MKQKYTITVAGMDINIITDQAPETVESIVGTIDRRIREINLRSPRCSRTESALLCAMDYCADKLTLGERVKVLEAEIASLVKPEERSSASDAELEAAERELADAKAALEAIKSRLEASEAEVKALEEQLRKAEEEQNSEQSEALSSALERIALLESGADELAEDVKVKNQKLEQASEKIEELNSENAALRAELEELRASRAVKAEKIAFFAEAGSEEAKSERPAVRRYSDKKSDSAEQITIDGEEIPQADTPTAKRRERRLGTFDLLSSDDV